MKAHIAVALAISAVFACATNGSQPSANAPSNQPSNAAVTDIPANEQASGQESTVTTTSAERRNVSGTNPNAGASRASGEAAPSPPKTGTEGHGLLPRTPSPMPVNTGDPCGPCNRVPESH